MPDRALRPMKKLLFPLVGLVFLLAGCNGTVPPVTAEPAEVTPPVAPTETAVPSPTPTLDPTATPTETPEPTPTQVPEYIGLPAAEVETLRQECLAQNPDSLCLPLPVSPFAGPVGQNFQIQEVSEVLVDVDTSEGRLRVEDFYLTLPLPFQATVRSLGSGEVRVFASHPDSLGLWGDPVKAGRDLTKFDWLIFHWGPFQEVQDFQDDYPELALVIRKADGSKFSPEDLVLLVGNRQDVSMHQSLVTIGGMDLVLRIYRYGPQRMVAGFPVSESHVTLRDLLRSDAGSIVYALPASQ